MNRAKSRGQGVIEYAGALVIAAVLIGVALVTLPPGAYEFLSEMQEGILAYLVEQVEGIGDG